MLAKTAKSSFSSNDWVFEVKWDGVRAIAYINDTLSIRSRNGHEIAGQFPELSVLSTLAPGTVLDGEIVAMTRGKPDIQALLPRLQNKTVRSGQEQNPVTYIVFDILEKEGKSLTELTFAVRRKILEEAVKEGSHVVLSRPVESRGEEYYQAAVAQGLEGIMAKRKDSRYDQGLRSEGWLKIKMQKTCDCVIAGYTIGKGIRGSSFGSLLLGLYDIGGTGTLVYIGKVGTGFSVRDQANLMETFSALETSTPGLTGADQKDKVTWLKPELVCEVAYQEVTRDRKLRIPRFIRIRLDKNAAECTIDQLDGVNAHVGATLAEEKVQKREHKNTPIDRSITKETMTDDQKRKSLELSLKNYQGRRDFAMTHEPSGNEKKIGIGNYFVVHEHHARHLHYDLRLERDGVLKSWAVPKGIPEAPGEKRLAVAVEDHPLEYRTFEGTIPQGEYGAGTVTIWDKGWYITLRWDDEKIEVVFHGERLNGHYVLVRFKRAGKSEWLVFKAGG